MAVKQRLGLNVGLIVQGIDGDARRRAYNADIDVYKRQG